jgi:hypothetical protein
MDEEKDNQLTREVCRRILPLQQSYVWRLAKPYHTVLVTFPGHPKKQ